MRDGVNHLLPIGAQHAGNNGGRRHANQQHVVKADAVVAVLQSKYALDLVGLDHRRQHVVHRQRFFALCAGQPAQVVSGGQDAAEVI